MFARIDHERTVREGLEQQRQELLKRKQKLIADNKRRKDDLANLDNDLEKFIDVRSAQHPLLGSTLTSLIGCETHPEALRERSLRMVTCSHRFLPFSGPTFPTTFQNRSLCIIISKTAFGIGKRTPASKMRDMYLGCGKKIKSPTAWRGRKIAYSP